MSDLTSELRRMAEDAAGQARPLAAGDVIRRGDGRRRRSVMWQSLGALSLAGLATAVVLAVTAPAPSSRHAAHRPPIQLAAWTVTKLPNGEVSVRVFRILRNPAGLQRKLRAEGVPASVVTYPPGPCRHYPASQRLLNRVFPGAYRLRPPPGNVLVIRPAALPAGAGVQLAGYSARHRSEGYIAAPTLVHTSPRCTGT